MSRATWNLSPTRWQSDRGRKLGLNIFFELMLTRKAFWGHALQRPVGTLSFSCSRVVQSDLSDEDNDRARQWFAQLGRDTIPRKIAVTKYVRSSGPGGQKVNKYISCSMQ